MGRGHDVVGQEGTLVVRHARINHGGRRTGLSRSQQIQVPAHLGLGGTRAIDNLDRHHASDHQHHEDTNEGSDHHRSLLAPARGRRGRHSCPSGRRWSRNLWGCGRCGYHRCRVRLILLSAHHVLLTTLTIRSRERDAFRVPVIQPLWRAQYHAVRAVSQRTITERIRVARPQTRTGNTCIGCSLTTLEGEGHSKVRLTVSGHHHHSVVIETRVDLHRQADVPSSGEQCSLPCRDRVRHAPRK